MCTGEMIDRFSINHAAVLEPTSGKQSSDDNKKDKKKRTLQDVNAKKLISEFSD